MMFMMPTRSAPGVRSPPEPASRAKAMAGSAGPASGGCERSVDVREDVVRVLEADREANVIGRDTGRRLLLGRELRVGGRGRVDGQCLGVAHVGQVRYELEAVDEAAAHRRAPLNAEAQDRARASRQILLGAAQLAARLEPRVVHPGHLLVALQMAGDG